MPPKKQQQQQQQGPSKKTIDKKKEKIVEDKTFGLKNKKGKKQQQFIKTVTNQVKFGGQSQQKRETDEYLKRKERTVAEKERAALDSLFKPVQTQRISAGADPKSVLCLFFKQGQCTKGDKCKFSHDLSLEGKTEKRSMYVDKRDKELENDTIDQWDEDKLKEVVKKKHETASKQKTDIVCKHFLRAIEKGIYGWFWECPNGDKCIYRHALPPGFVFKKQLKEQEELQPQNTITLEELVEEEREQIAQSGKTLTKVTFETFLAWKKRKLNEKSAKAEEQMAQRKEAFKAGRTHGISGREMFLFNPELVEDDDQDMEDEETVVVRRAQDCEGQEEAGLDVTDVSGLIQMTIPTVPSGDTSHHTVGDASGGTTAQAGTVDETRSFGTNEGASAAARGETNPLSLETDIPVDEALFIEDDPVTNETDIPVDEALFIEDDPVTNETNEHDSTGNIVRLKLVEHEEEITVDEALFDVDNLEDLDLGDPSLLNRLAEEVGTN